MATKLDKKDVAIISAAIMADLAQSKGVRRVSSADVKKRVEALVETIAELEGRIDDLSSTVDELKERVEQLEKR